MATIKNKSNFPKRVNGVRIGRDETEEVDLSDDRVEELRQSIKFEVVKPQVDNSSEEEDDGDDSKSEEQDNKEGDD